MMAGNVYRGQEGGGGKQRKTDNNTISFNTKVRMEKMERGGLEYEREEGSKREASFKEEEF